MKNFPATMNGASRNGDDQIDPLELEPALGKADENGEPSAESLGCNPVGWCRTLGLLICMYAQHYRTATTVILSGLVILIVVLMLEALANASTTKYHAPKIVHDYTQMASVYDMQLAQVDHWCLMGGDDDCRCDDPTIGLPSEERGGWTHAHHLNKKLVAAKAWDANLDLVMFGAAAVEEWNGRHLGAPKDDFKDVHKFWKKTFTKGDGGEIDGLALGIAGDMTSNLLWRFRHGEGPPSLNPDVWWISVGMDDLGYGQCAEEVVLLGILRLAEEIMASKPGATVVINSILPRKSPLKRKKKKTGLDLNPYIQVVNEQLKAFCDKHPQVEFFDTTSIFASVSGKKTVVKSDMYIDDGVHLNLAGHKAWGTAVKKRVKAIVAAKQEAAQSAISENDYYGYMGSDPNAMFDVDDDWKYDEFTEGDTYSDDLAWEYGDDFRRRDLP